MTMTIWGQDIFEYPRPTVGVVTATSDHKVHKLVHVESISQPGFYENLILSVKKSQVSGR